MEKTVERTLIVCFGMSLRCGHALQRRSSCVFRFFRLAAKSACGCFGVLGSTGICYAFRCHVDELPQTIFHKGIFKTALSENWCSACDLDCVLLCFLSHTGDDRVDRMACIFK